MPDTSASLLDRLHDRPDDAAWQRLVEIYTPLIRGWLKRHWTPDADVDDLVQEVLAVVVRKLPEFRHNQRTGAFRSWLRAITANCLRDFWRSRRRRPTAGDADIAERIEQLADQASGLSRLWDQEHDRHVARRLMELIEPEFERSTWRAFQRVAVDGAPADQAAAELGISVNAVFIAKSRVLGRLRQESRGLLE
jgi:RNA polymerase sigma-70 factor (ECF subfamily)